jgi:hypothetical protein
MLVVVDYETCYTDGSAALEYWREDFRVESAAFLFSSKDCVEKSFTLGEQETKEVLNKHQDSFFICHNQQFEHAVSLFRYPELDIKWYADTARLAQLADNGNYFKPRGYKGPQVNYKKMEGYSLVNCCRRWVEGYPEEGHKERYHALIRERGGRRGREGSYLHLLTKDELEAYNVEDVQATWDLFRALTHYLDRVGYDWRIKDRDMYNFFIDKQVRATARGIKVDREYVTGNLATVDDKIYTIEKEFRASVASDLEILEAENRQKLKEKFKTKEAQERHLACEDEWRFNPGSSVQLEALFCRIRGVNPQFETSEGIDRKKRKAKGEKLAPYKPRPSFKSAHLSSYGPEAAILEDLGSIKIVRRTQDALLHLSQRDGKWHHHVRVNGTSTDRFKGGGSKIAVDGVEYTVNPQGMARSEQALMAGLIPSSPKRSFISADLGSGEPTVTCHFSGDPNYYQACFGMRGVLPYYKGDVLQIDSIYFMVASVSPIGASAMKEAFNTTYEGKSFSQKWVEDSDWMKKELASIYKPHKTLSLAKTYGQQPKGTVKYAYDRGVSITLSQSEQFDKVYWYKSFPKVRLLAGALRKRMREQGSMLTTFGYRLRSWKSADAFNHFIQAHISGYMKYLTYNFFKNLEKEGLSGCVHFVKIVHDEIIFEIDTDREEEVKKIYYRSLDELNQSLNWNVTMTSGWVRGSNLYEAK